MAHEKKAKELNNRKDGDRRACPICNPRKDRVPLWKVWKWSKAHPGKSPWKDDDKVDKKHGISSS